MCYRNLIAVIASIIFSVGSTFANPDDPCRADVNKDSELSNADFTSWIDAYNNLKPEADQNCDGSIDPTDWTTFLANYNAGCDLVDPDNDGIASVYEDGGLEWFGLHKRGTDSMDDDSDDDGLTDGVEIPTYVYISPTSTGTDPNEDDTDGDTLTDGDEVLGTSGGLDLPAIGCNPNHKDILVEIDWEEPLPSISTDPNYYRPHPNEISRVIDMFDAAIVPNPDGITGITLHVDYGQGDWATMGTSIPDRPSYPFPSPTNVYFTNHFDSTRVNYFRYGTIVDNLQPRGSAYGRAYFLWDSFVGDNFSDSLTFAHELGHNLGLGHGGHSNVNNKHNYNSIMNYRYSQTGIDTNNDLLGDGVLDYSYGTNDPLVFNNLNEHAGVYGTVPIDWNGNGQFDDTYVSWDIINNVACLGTTSPLINVVAGCETPAVLAGYCVLNPLGGSPDCDRTSNDHDDWSNLIYGIASSNRNPHDVTVYECELHSH